MSEVSEHDPSASLRRFHTIVNSRPEKATELPRLSQDVVDYLGVHGQSAEEIAQLPAVVVPDFDDTKPLTHYFASTSHNTYLLGYQLWGKAASSSYAYVIANGARCVEIDVWPKKDSNASFGPIVTHGWTLAQDIAFKDVCIAINNAFEAKPDDLPLFVSLECHVPADGQQELVDIMVESWGDKLAMHPAVTDDSVDDDVATVGALRGKIVMMIEYYPQANPGELTESLEDLDIKDEEESDKTITKITDALSNLGFYAHSMKPSKDWLTKGIRGPLNVIINISESALSALLPTQLQTLIENGQKYLRRVYPRGTRIASGNLDPMKFWRAGSHFAALNWQDFDLGMQLNEAMFSGTGGWVLKPDFLRDTPSTGNKNMKLYLEIGGLSALPRPGDDTDFYLQVRIHVLHGKEDEWRSKSLRCKSVSEAGVDLLFNESCEWEFEDDDFTFIRILVTKDRKLNDQHLGIFCTRLKYMEEGWRFLRLLDSKGKDTHSTLLIRCKKEPGYVATHK